MKVFIRVQVLLLFFLFLFSAAYGQKATGKLQGVVRDSLGAAVPFSTVFIKEIAKGVAADENGGFVLNNIPSGTYKVNFFCQGYTTVERQLTIKPDSLTYITVQLREKAILIKDVVITAKSEVAEVKELPFAVASIDAKSFHNSSSDVNTILDQTAGIRIREEGGLGSGFDLNLNGLSGNQVKFFIDGVPMEFFSQSMSLNNFPANIIDRIEVYKGVVPINLGSDALGGAINIITRQSHKNYVDASYSFGSFNTHRASFNSQIINQKTGFMVKSSAFYNHSDNNYWTNVSLHDPNTGKYSEPQDVRRFHDAYSSKMVQLQAGWRNKKLADELLFGVTVSGNRDDVQHAISLDRVFGAVYTKSSSVMPSLQYRKYDFLTKGLAVKAFASYGMHQNAVSDTSSRQYDWLGNYTIKNNKEIGEASWQKSLFSFDDRTYLASVSADYQLRENHQLSFNYTQNYLNRTGEDPLRRTKGPFEDPNILDKKTFGLSHTLKLFDQKWVTTTFGKFYLLDARVANVDYNNVETEVASDFRKPGFGLASTYHFSDAFQVKSSFEKAYRIPSGYEMFGDGLLLLNNPFLLPEQSYNGNLGVLFSKKIDKLAVQAESNLFIRDSKNMIRIEGTGILSQFVNVSDARSSGIEGGVNLDYNQFISLGLNATYQDIINTTQYEKGRVSHVYLDRIPNIPYFFANAQAGVHFRNTVLQQDRLSLFWRGRFIEDYFLKWPSLGDPSNKHVIPSQFIQDIEVTYSAKNERYNVSFSSHNILDAKAYDQFRLQKPGRSFFLKIRYFLTNNS
ncbi:TonB-dependent receptor [Pontibacter diazotrophicus]|uniref:TonB-dependent receptor n=1 Tax=Pontibacter diazotrophicus TaxID=1400979 RepID=A0A3D8L9Z9_9BACT|nr:TonB-dependent receptor [Pontibacter diazotrophicus]RDV14251.1 TonB-dependent receptor [Pontibacter diazotrophicus]